MKAIKNSIYEFYTQKEMHKWQKSRDGRKLQTSHNQKSAVHLPVKTHT